MKESTEKKRKSLISQLWTVAVALAFLSLTGGGRLFTSHPPEWREIGLTWRKHCMPIVMGAFCLLILIFVLMICFKNKVDDPMNTPWGLFKGGNPHREFQRVCPTSCHSSLFTESHRGLYKPEVQHHAQDLCKRCAQQWSVAWSTDATLVSLPGREGKALVSWYTPAFGKTTNQQMQNPLQLLTHFLCLCFGFSWARGAFLSGIVINNNTSEQGYIGVI